MYEMKRSLLSPLVLYILFLSLSEPLSIVSLGVVM